MIEWKMESLQHGWLYMQGELENVSQNKLAVLLYRLYMREKNYSFQKLRTTFKISKDCRGFQHYYCYYHYYARNQISKFVNRISFSEV